LSTQEAYQRRTMQRNRQTFKASGPAAVVPGVDSCPARRRGAVPRRAARRRDACSLAVPLSQATLAASQAGPLGSRGGVCVCCAVGRASEKTPSVNPDGPAPEYPVNDGYALYFLRTRGVFLKRRGSPTTRGTAFSRITSF
jgi:hypothetical protein